MLYSTAYSILGLVGLAGLVSAQDLLSASSSPDEIRAATRPIVDDILAIYKNTSGLDFIPGVLPRPYYWWEGGLMIDSLINYWALSGDDSVVDTIGEALVWQASPGRDFSPANQSRSLSNDDQCTWALAAMTAAEYGFPVPKGFNSTWAQLAINVWQAVDARWDNGTCGGGFRWQIYEINTGYNYKNSISAASFTQLAARLAKFTQNTTYSDSADRTVKWMFDIGFATLDGKLGAIYDGGDASQQCDPVNHLQWTNNAGLFASAYAYACNDTSSSACTQNMKDIGLAAMLATQTSFNDGAILYEVACAPDDTCNTDQLSFRAPLARALASVRDMISDKPQYIPEAAVEDLISASAMGAAAQCFALDPKTANCGVDWSRSRSDGQSGLGQDLAALEIILASLPRKAIRKSDSGATSTTSTDASAGSGSQTSGTATTVSGTASSTADSDSGAIGLLPSVALLAFSLVGSSIVVFM